MYIIREATQGDCNGIGKVYCDSWKAAYQNILPQNYLNSLTVTNCTPEKVSVDDIVLLKQERVVGICHISEERNLKDKVWGEIVAIYLLPDMWGSGVGSQLFQSAIKKLEYRGFKNICLWVLKDNIRARKFYERNGFTVSGNKREIKIAGCNIIEVLYIYNS